MLCRVDQGVSSSLTSWIRNLVSKYMHSRSFLQVMITADRLFVVAYFLRICTFMLPINVTQVL